MWLLCKTSIQERHNLSPCAGTVWRKCSIGGPCCDSSIQRPVNSSGRYVSESCVRGIGRSSVLPHEFHRQFAGAGIVGSKYASAYYIAFLCPSSGLCVVNGCIHVRECRNIFWFRRSRSPPQESNDFGLCAGFIRSKSGSVCAIGDAFRYSPCNGAGIVCLLYTSPSPRD